MRTHLKHALFSPAHPLAILAIVVLVVLAPIAWNPGTTAACTAVSLLADALVLVVVSRTPGHRRSVDRALQRCAREELDGVTR